MEEEASLLASDDWMGVRGKQRFPRLAERGGSRSLRTSFSDLSEKWSEAIAGAGLAQRLP